MFSITEKINGTFLQRLMKRKLFRWNQLYFTFKLPGEEKAEFVLSIPYTPKQSRT